MNVRAKGVVRKNKILMDVYKDSLVSSVRHAIHKGKYGEVDTPKAMKSAYCAVTS